MVKSLAALLPALAWTGFSAFFLSTADITLRSWQKTPWPYGFTAAFLLYMIGMICMMLSFMRQNIAAASVAAVVANTSVFILASYFLYGDKITPMQGAGLLLGLVALALLEIG